MALLAGRARGGAAPAQRGVTSYSNGSPLAHVLADEPGIQAIGFHKKANKWQPLQEFLSKRFEPRGIISPGKAITTVCHLASRFYKNPTGMTLAPGQSLLERHTASISGLPIRCDARPAQPDAGIPCTGEPAARGSRGSLGWMLNSGQRPASARAARNGMAAPLAHALSHDQRVPLTRLLHASSTGIGGLHRVMHGCDRPACTDPVREGSASPLPCCVRAASPEAPGGRQTPAPTICYVQRNRC